MRIRIDIKKVGDHWYPCLHHSDPNCLSLDPKMERWLNKYDFMEDEQVSIYLVELHSIVEGDMIIDFNEDDIRKYLETPIPDSFIMNMYIGTEAFYISSELYYLLEKEHNFNFHKSIYRLEIW